MGVVHTMCYYLKIAIWGPPKNFALSLYMLDVFILQSSKGNLLGLAEFCNLPESLQLELVASTTSVPQFLDLRMEHTDLMHSSRAIVGLV